MSFLQSLCRHLKSYGIRRTTISSGKLLNVSQSHVIEHLRDVNTGGLSFFFPATSASRRSAMPSPVTPTGIIPDLGLLNRVSNIVATYVPARGLKYKGRVKRRCKDCQLVWQDGNLYNFCKPFPRHKQMLKPRYWQNERIFTHWQNSPKRPW